MRQTQLLSLREVPPLPVALWVPATPHQPFSPYSAGHFPRRNFLLPMNANLSGLSMLLSFKMLNIKQGSSTYHSESLQYGSARTSTTDLPDSEWMLSNHYTPESGGNTHRNVMRTRPMWCHNDLTVTAWGMTSYVDKVNAFLYMYEYGPGNDRRELQLSRTCKKYVRNPLTRLKVQDQ